MKGVLSFIIIALLVVPPALATTSLLRLQRAETPMGPWQEVPANTLPITEAGELQDTFESPTGYYRMEIEPGADWGFPLNIPLEDVPPVAVNCARSRSF